MEPERRNETPGPEVPEIGHGRSDAKNAEQKIRLDFGAREKESERKWVVEQVPERVHVPESGQYTD